MNELERGLSRLIIQLRWLWVILMPLLVFFAAGGAQHLEFTNNYRVFFSADNPELRAFESLEKKYSQDDNVLFLLTPRETESTDSGVFQRQALTAIEELTERAWQIPYSTRVDSISNYQHTSAEEDDLLVRDLVENASELSADELAQRRDIASQEPLLRSRLITPDTLVTGVNVTVTLPRQDETKEVPAIVEHSRAIQADFATKYPEIDIRLGGMTMMNNAFSEASKADMGFLVPISFGVMLVLLALLLKGFVGTLVTTLVILLSIVSAMGLGGYTGFPITPPSASAPIIILTIAIANSVHLLVTYQQSMGAGHDRAETMMESLRVNLQPIFLTSLTTAIGFLSMNFSDAPPFRHLGNFVAYGVLASFLLSITFLPALMVIIPNKARTKGGALHHEAMERLGDWVVKQRHRLLLGMGAVIVALVAMVPMNELNDVFVRYFDESIEFRRDADYQDKTLGGLYRIDYDLQTGEASGISEPKFLADMGSLVDWLRDQPEVVYVNGLTDIMKRLNKNMHGDDPSWYRLPERRDLAAQYLLLYEMSLPYGLDLNNQINVDKSATRISVGLRTLSTKQVLGFEQRVQAWMRANAPDLHSVGTSPTIMFAHIGERNIRSMLGGTTVALILISGILVFALRSLKIGLISLAPNLVPAGMAFGLWGLLVGEVGLALSVVTGMTLGIVVDDTVHFLSKYLRARREKGLSSPDAVRYAFSNVGMALVITSIVLVGGFLVLALSNFELNSGMGLLTAVVISFALLADFLFLPPLLMKLEGDQDAKPAENANAVPESV
ncbi:MAG: efflux RND transporter permease subunit [Gammaproteobacteria bacterium]